MNTVFEIRSALQWSQSKLADEIGVSFATVNRWENEKSTPNRLAQEKMLAICEENHITLAEIIHDAIIGDAAEISAMHPDKMVLYHGSKSGIQGKIKPASRDRCDFGTGFYMGTDPLQPLTLICDYEQSVFYILSVDLHSLKTLDVPADIEWAMLVAYHRGRMETTRGTKFFQKYQELDKGYDMVIGSIANDRMFYVLDSFFEGTITDTALVKSLSALKLGRQYVAITQKACDAVKIEREVQLLWMERQALKKASEQNRSNGIAFANQICKEYRREGRFFDEILDGAKQRR